MTRASFNFKLAEDDLARDVRVRIKKLTRPAVSKYHNDIDNESLASLILLNKSVDRPNTIIHVTLSIFARFPFLPYRFFTSDVFRRAISQSLNILTQDITIVLS